MAKNKYVDFISDKHLLKCISNLHYAYNIAKDNITKKDFYSNKVDTIKLTFDAQFNGMSQEDIVKTEVLRQIDKSINNSIGMFHERVLGGIEGYEIGNFSGYDIKATDNTLFADIKNKHNTINSSSAESLFQKLKQLADGHKGAKCYWVQILAKGSFEQKWEGEINGKEYSHSRVYKISGDKFYALLTEQDDAFFQLYKALPSAITDFMKTISHGKVSANSAIDEIKATTEASKRSILDEITFENYSYYLGFDKL